jgi:hypothetical protein
MNPTPTPRLIPDLSHDSADTSAQVHHSPLGNGLSGTGTAIRHRLQH